MSQANTPNKNNNLDCNDAANCNNADCQRALADKHEITESDYNSMVSAFFGTAVPAAKQYSLSAMQALLDADCADHCIEYSATYSNTSSNSDISLSTSTNMHGSSRYSIAMLNGVILNTSPDNFYFSKAKDGNKDTVIFKAVKNGATVYCGDMSNLFP